MSDNTGTINIETANPHDLQMVYWLFDEAIAYQNRNGYVAWNGYDKVALQKEIQDKRLYKITNGKDILCIFCVLFADPVIWQEREKGDAVYLHRIVVNPNFKGQRCVEKIVNWAKVLAKEEQLKFIRMDTWAANPILMEYYKSFGFEFLEYFTIPETDGISSQYHNLKIALLEMRMAGGA